MFDKQVSTCFWSCSVKIKAGLVLFCALLKWLCIFFQIYFSYNFISPTWWFKKKTVILNVRNMHTWNLPIQWQSCSVWNNRSDRNTTCKQTWFLSLEHDREACQFYTWPVYQQRSEFFTLLNAAQRFVCQGGIWNQVCLGNQRSKRLDWREFPTRAEGETDLKLQATLITWTTLIPWSPFQRKSDERTHTWNKHAFSLADG
jgi:hypothetical protein